MPQITQEAKMKPILKTTILMQPSTVIGPFIVTSIAIYIMAYSQLYKSIILKYRLTMTSLVHISYTNMIDT